MSQAELQDLQRLIAGGQHQQALQQAKALTAREPTNADAWFLQAGAARGLQDRSAADAAIRHALLIQPFHPAYHALQGELWLDQGLKAEAEAAFKRALAARGDFLPAVSALAVLLMDTQRPEEALPLFIKCVELRAEAASNWNNLGVCHLALRKPAEASRSFAQAIQRDPNYLPARYNQARTLISLGNDQEAAPHLAEILRQFPNDPEATYLTGMMCHRNGDFETAQHFLRLAAASQPPRAPAINALAEFVWEQGDDAIAREMYAEALKADPSNIRSRLGAALSLPMAVTDPSAIDAVRTDYARRLEQLANQLEALQMPARAEVDSGVRWTNFLLAYHGRDDRDLQVRYGNLLTQLLRRVTPKALQAAPKGSGGKRRIGFVSHHFHECTVGRYFESWITGIDRTRFEIILYSTNARFDALSRRLAGAGRWVNAAGAGLFELAQGIHEDAPDILVYPELGMHPLVMPLAAMRLAPLQVAGWGHPVTTGLPTIDVFLSSADMEPEGADHYSERLVTLPGIGTRIQPGETDRTGTRSDYSLPEEARLYLVPQSVYKIHPDNDALHADILARDERAVLVFFATDRHKVAHRIHQQRLERALAARGVAPAGRVRILPQTSHADFLRIMQLCDLMVDTLHWSGGHTSLDALSMGLPIVTVEGEFMRGRQSAAMLRTVGLPELIAAEAASLPALAVDVARDADRLSALRNRLAEGQSRLFGQSAGVAAFEAFLDQSLAQAG